MLPYIEAIAGALADRQIEDLKRWWCTPSIELLRLHNQTCLSANLNMGDRRIFHLSIPVSNLKLAKRFYVEVLAASVGRENEEWLDILLWGQQITLQHRPAEVLPAHQQGKRHFGVTLPWDEWEHEVERLRTCGASFLAEPKVFNAGSPEEHAKFFLADPSHNIIEIKTYRDIQAAIGLPNPNP